MFIEINDRWTVNTFYFTEIFYKEISLDGTVNRILIEDLKKTLIGKEWLDSLEAKKILPKENGEYIRAEGHPGKIVCKYSIYVLEASVTSQKKSIYLLLGTLDEIQEAYEIINRGLSQNRNFVSIKDTIKQANK